VDRGAWNTFPLMRAAQEIDENIAHCPRTWAAASRCPLLRGLRGGVYFSILDPGTHVRPHCGPSNLKLRYHLAVEDDQGARIRSDGQWRSWRAGSA
jgi:aspartate beta-hydroxylase